MRLWRKKVLLRECKKHTTRRVASTRSVALSPGGWGRRGGGGCSLSSPGWGRGHTIQSWPRGYTIQSCWGVPHLVLSGGYSPSHPWQGVCHPDLAGVPLSGLDGVPPIGDWMGYPTVRDWMRGTDMGSGTGVPPGKDMGPVDGCIMGWRWGTPCEQTHACENSTYPIPSEYGR